MLVAVDAGVIAPVAPRSRARTGCLLAPLVAGLLGETSPPPLQWVQLPLAGPIPATGDRVLVADKEFNWE